LSHINPRTIVRMQQTIISWLPKIPQEYVIICIGTDRSTGDALGPLTGTFLQEKGLKHFTVYGNLHEPVHATNLHTYINKLYKYHQEPFVIAVDACLGKRTSVGHIITRSEERRVGKEYRYRWTR